MKAFLNENAVDEAIEREAKLLKALNASLHEMSQPITVLLCALEYGGSLASAAEMREMFKVSQEACERLRAVSAAMREKVREAIEQRAAKRVSVL